MSRQKLRLESPDIDFTKIALAGLESDHMTQVFYKYSINFFHEEQNDFHGHIIAAFNPIIHYWLCYKLYSIVGREIIFLHNILPFNYGK